MNPRICVVGFLHRCLLTCSMRGFVVSTCNTPLRVMAGWLIVTLYVYRWSPFHFCLIERFSGIIKAMSVFPVGGSQAFVVLFHHFPVHPRISDTGLVASCTWSLSVSANVRAINFHHLYAVNSRHHRYKYILILYLARLPVKWGNEVTAFIFQLTDTVLW